MGVSRASLGLRVPEPRTAMASCKLGVRSFVGALKKNCRWLVRKEFLLALTWSGGSLVGEQARAPPPPGPPRAPYARPRTVAREAKTDRVGHATMPCGVVPNQYGKPHGRARKVASHSPTREGGQHSTCRGPTVMQRRAHDPSAAGLSPRRCHVEVGPPPQVVAWRHPASSAGKPLAGRPSTSLPAVLLSSGSRTAPPRP